MKALIRKFALALAALALLAAPVAAQARPYGGGGGGGGGYYHGHHGWGHGGLFWGGVGLGIGLGVGSYYYDYGPRWYPGYVVAVPPVYTVGPAPEPQARSAPDPVIYPNRGQSPAQTEADRQDCNRWATTQPRAMAEASVFHRATLACMEGRGYTVK